jgi:centractin
MKHIEY